MNIRLSSRLLGSASLLLLSLAPAHAGILGNAAIDRAFADGWSDFAVVLLDASFSTDAIVTDWEVYANVTAAGGTGDLGILLLRSLGSDKYSIVASDVETVTGTGNHMFAFNPDSGTAQVQAGDLLGLYIGSARIEYDRVGSQDLVSWSPSSNTITDVSQLAAGSELTLSGNGNNDDRIYSANVTYIAIPEPSALLGLVTLGSLGALMLRRRR